MKGRRKGRPTKWVSAQVEQSIYIGKPGVKFEVWGKWKKKDRKLGTLVVSVGGLRWKPMNGKTSRPKSWNDVAELFASAN
ncbi:MAG TPA: hypothetical protein VGI75_12040 [Pirellulales bacterium]|jgi:hypothetical protein